MRSWVFLLLFTAASLAGCARCGGCGGVPARDGAFPYRACLLEKGEEPRSVPLEGEGGGTLEVEEREARFAKSPLRIAAFRGAAGANLEEIAASIREERVDLLVLIGSAGREREAIRAQLEALLAIGPPLLILAGGDDSLTELDRAIGSLGGDEKARLLDGRRLHLLRAGDARVALIPGAPEGRFAYDDSACGYDASDLRARLRAADPEPLIIAWSFAGEALEESAARGGIFAFPAEAAKRAKEGGEGIFTVGPIAGDPYFSGTGYRAPAPSLFSLSERGFVFIGEIMPRADARMVPPAKP